MFALPKHLRKYVVEQSDGKYTPVDQAVWRFILRQLKAFLSKHAHESYLEGLEKTGIEIERIPRISEISEKLSKFGWRAVPVSGFIPPAAFMELQSLSILPIASDLRTLDHLLYTPAPDIVHEAAGHAPMLVNPEFAHYLHEYGQVARKAIISREDLELYEAIRHLSDVKENPSSTPEEVQKAQDRLDRVSKSISHVSEAAELSRMNWWTAEYGLIGSLKNPKIYGAGLLSSVGESRWCLSDKVKKIPLTVDCIRTSYDITEPQPQLFVTPDFETLTKVLHEFAGQMAFKTGGLTGLQKALSAKTVNTVQWSSGAQVGGELCEVLQNAGEVIYLRFQGPSQIAYGDRQLTGHGREYHKDGFGSPVGKIQGFDKCPSKFTESDLATLGLKPGGRVSLNFVSGVRLEGTFEKKQAIDGRILIMTFTNCRVTWGDRVLFDPSWGTYDLVTGDSIPSVSGGPPDREAFGETEDFVAARVPERNFTEEELLLHSQYERMRSLREEGLKGEVLLDHIQAYLLTHDKHFPDDWLYRIEALELVLNRAPNPKLEMKIREDLERIKKCKPDAREVIDDGIQQAERI
jgi:phenylalanine-4-hydroxylase